MILQIEAAECGLACLAMIAAHHGHEADLPTLRRRYGLSLKGATLAQLIQIAGQMQLASRPLKLALDDLPKLKRPCILHWDFNHFVVLHSIRGNTVTILDPAIGRRVLKLDEVSKHFTGVALELTPTPGFEKKVERQRVPLAALWRGLPGKSRALIQLFVLSLALQLFALLAPLHMQLVIDQALPAADADLLTVLAVGFGLLVLIQTATDALRGWVVLRLSTAMQFQMVANLLHHLLRLPMGFFEKRHLGDVMSRFDSLESIQRTFTTSFIEAVVDGLMMLLALGLMLLYSVKLTLLVLLAVLLYGLLRWVAFAPLREASQDEIMRAAKQQSHFLESVRGVQALKLFNRQADREAVWQNLFVDRLNAQVKVAGLGIGFSAANSLLYGLENVLVIWLGAKLVMAGGFSVGMLFAFISYKNQFTDKTAALIEKIIEFRMLGLHAERVGDVALAQPETVLPQALSHLRLKGAMTVEQLGFRHSDLEPWVFRGLSFSVQAGESVVIAGPSGCGKTTLLKVLLGLLPANEGKIMVDGQPLASLGIHWRENLGAVMQEDTLFAGSLADNIAFSDPNPDPRRIEGASRLAAVHDEITRMPMAYNTLVGDMGSALSGGQKQRVLLARALYKLPRLLFLDEASSHLDVTAERAINDNLGKLKITRIAIAHRPETIQAGDTVLWMGPELPQTQA